MDDMNKYNQVITEIDAAIKELKNVKRTMLLDVISANKGRYSPILGSKAMFHRAKLNIRDCFRRMESNFDWQLHGCYGDYHSIIAIGAKTLKDGEHHE